MAPLIINDKTSSRPTAPPAGPSGHRPRPERRVILRARSCRGFQNSCWTCDCFCGPRHGFAEEIACRRPAFTRRRPVQYFHAGDGTELEPEEPFGVISAARPQCRRQSSHRADCSTRRRHNERERAIRKREMADVGETFQARAETRQAKTRVRARASIDSDRSMPNKVEPCGPRNRDTARPTP